MDVVTISDVSDNGGVGHARGKRMATIILWSIIILLIQSVVTHLGTCKFGPATTGGKKTDFKLDPQLFRE